MYLSKIEACNQCMLSVKKIIKTLNKNQLQMLEDEIFANEYFFNKGVLISNTYEEIDFLRRVSQKVQTRLLRPNVPLEYTASGLVLTRGTSLGSMEQFYRSLGNGWERSYMYSYEFGYFLNKSKFQIVCYLEHDVNYMQANTIEQFNFEIESIGAFRKPTSHEFSS